MVLERICVIGSGNWGTTVAKIIGTNVKKFPDEFEPIVRMWVFEETLPDGRLLSAVINQERENIKYLPGIRLPDNILAISNLVESVRDASLLVFVTPHQFIRSLCQGLRDHLHPEARGISLIKGVEVEPECGLRLISDIIREELKIDVSVLMGANIANEVAQEQFCESTLGYRQQSNALAFQKLFQTEYFRVSLARDVAGVELCGALKNVVALGAGFVDGLGLGENSKAAIIRIGLKEMKDFCLLCHEHVQESTFWESCGVADLITTCYGGRNRKVAEAVVKRGKSIMELEEEMLNGQKLQGPPAAKEVYAMLQSRGMLAAFPLLTSIYRICYQNAPPISLIQSLAQ